MGQEVDVVVEHAPAKAVAIGRAVEATRRNGFDEFVRAVEPALRGALTAKFGPERGQDATGEALAWAFEHFDEVEERGYGVGYLYRVGASKTRSFGPPISSVREVRDAGVEQAVPALDNDLWAALMNLTERQRVAVVLVHAYGWQMKDVALLLDISVPSVGTHLRRALRALRRALGDQLIDEEVRHG